MEKLSSVLDPPRWRSFAKREVIGNLVFGVQGRISSLEISENVQAWSHTPEKSVATKPIFNHPALCLSSL